MGGGGQLDSSSGGKKINIHVMYMLLYKIQALIIPSPTKLQRDIVTLSSVRPSFRNILLNTLESTSFNGF